MKIQWLSLRYKLLAALTIIPLCGLAVVLWLATTTFSSDKIASLSDASLWVSKTRASRVSTELNSVVSLSQAIVLNYHSETKNMGEAGTAFFEREPKLLAFEIFALNSQADNYEKAVENSRASIRDALSKKSTVFEKLISQARADGMSVQSASDLAPGALMLAARYGEANDPHHVIAVTVFDASELNQVFASRTTDRSFLVRKSDSMPVFASTDLEKGWGVAQVWPEIAKSKTPEGATEVQSPSSNSYITTYADVGAAGLAVVSLSDKAAALASIEAVKAKSKFIFIAVFAAMMIISALISQKLAGAFAEIGMQLHSAEATSPAVVEAKMTDAQLREEIAATVDKIVDDASFDQSELEYAPKFRPQLQMVPRGPMAHEIVPEPAPVVVPEVAPVVSEPVIQHSVVEAHVEALADAAIEPQPIHEVPVVAHAEAHVESEIAAEPPAHSDQTESVDEDQQSFVLSFEESAPTPAQVAFVHSVSDEPQLDMLAMFDAVEAAPVQAAPVEVPHLSVVLPDVSPVAELASVEPKTAPIAPAEEVATPVVQALAPAVELVPEPVVVPVVEVAAPVVLPIASPAAEAAVAAAPSAEVKKPAVVLEFRPGRRPFGDTESAKRSAVEIFGITQGPAEKAGSDFWQTFEKGEKLFMAMGTISHRGAELEVAKEIVKSFFANLDAGPAMAPGAAMETLNRAIFEKFGGRTVLSFFFGCLDRHSGELVYVNASHRLPMVLRASSQLASPADFSPLEPVNNPRVGAIGHYQFQEAHAEIRSGDRFVLFSDGAVDVLSPGGKVWGEHRFLESLAFQFYGAQTTEQALKGVIENLNSFRSGQPLEQDASFIIVRFGKRVVDYQTAREAA